MSKLLLTWRARIGTLGQLGSMTQSNEEAKVSYNCIISLGFELDKKLRAEI